MTKKNVFKLLAVVAVLFFTVNVVSAQVANSDYVEYDPAALAPNGIDYVTLKSGGTTMGYYAEPDPIYHPNYNVVGVWALTADFLWNWSFSLAPGANPVLAKPGAANYVTATFLELGIYELDVQEEASAAFGGCVSAITQTIEILLIDPPTAQFAAGLGAAANCGDMLAQELIVEFTENVHVDLARYAFRISEVVENIDAANAVIGGALSTDDNYVNYAITAAAKVAPNGGTSPNFTLSGINTSAMTVQNGERTRYTYTLTSADGVTGTGVVSAISHKSDYLAGAVNAGGFGARTSVVFILNPAPVTGPIFHIPNNFRF